MGTAAGQPGTVTPPGTGTLGQPAGRGEPAQPGQQGQGQQGGNAGGNGAPPQQGQGGVGTGTEGEQQWNREELNPALRNLAPSQINELFSALLATRQTQEPAQPQPRQPAQPELPEINLREVMDPTHESYNPEAALKWFVQKNYGPLMQDISQRSLKGLYSNFRNQIHDFAEFEPEIDAALSQRDPSTLSERDIFGTYLAAKGMRVLNKERQERAQQSGRSTHQPSAPVNQDTVEEPLDATETEFARIMFPNAPDPAAKYREMKKKYAGGSYELTVPTGEGQRA